MELIRLIATSRYSQISIMHAMIIITIRRFLQSVILKYENQINRNEIQYNKNIRFKK